MILLLHTFLFLLICFTQSDFRAIDGDLSRQLALPGSALVPFIPLVALATFVLILRVTRRASKRRIRIGGVFAAYAAAFVCFAYPHWIFDGESISIGIGPYLKRDEMFLPPDEISNFEQTFNTTTAQAIYSDAGPMLFVPRRKFSPSMVSFLKSMAQEKAQSAGAPKGDEPRNSGTPQGPSSPASSVLTHGKMLPEGGLIGASLPHDSGYPRQ